MLLKTEPNYRADPFPIDDGSEIIFNFHLHRGELDPRMSAYEMAPIVIKHMSGIINQGILDNFPRAKAEFDAMRMLLIKTPPDKLDELLPWMRSLTRTEEDDVIRMSLFDNTPHPEGLRYYL